MPWGCLLVVAILVLAGILFFIGGWPMLVGAIAVGIIALVLYLRIDKAKQVVLDDQRRKWG